MLYPSTSNNILYRDRLDKAAAGNQRVREKSLPVWAAEMMEASYLPPYVKKDQIFVAPVSADVELLQSLQPNLAPAIIIVAGLDCLALEAMEYAGNLKKAGVKVMVKEYPEAIHGFSHYKEGSKDYRKDDVDDCWEEVVKFLAVRFESPASNI
jgi:acetyl esterase/lipase